MSNEEVKVKSEPTKDELVTEKVEANDASEPKIKAETEPTETEKVVEKDPLVDLFYSEIDEIKSEDFKTSSKEQLERLLRPGSTYFNLNPFEVLQIDPYAPIEEMRKKYRKLSMYVHPDKNRDQKDKAEIAFEAVNRAYKMLDDELERKKCLEVVEEARERVDKMCEEKRKKLRRDAIAAAAAAAADKSHKKSAETKTVSNKIEEDDPDKYRHAIYVMTCKIFADIERLKVREREKMAEEKKRKAVEKVDEEVKTKVKKEWDKNYEDSRQGRVSSWQNFVKKPSDPEKAKAAPVAAAKPLFFRPPKHKPESR